MNDSDVEQRARLLCQELVDGITKSNLCSITTAIYDTAWLSMISKKEGEDVRWLFPESHQYILNQQLSSGGWEAYATKEDEILNSLAALLALKRRQTSTDSSIKLQSAIQSATKFLDNALQAMDIDGSLPVGFEILVPAHLAMLESEGIHLSSPATDLLLAISEMKLKGFTPELLYGTADTTLLHSLEALTTKIDFDRIRHRKIQGSMMASPASTAAYLMNVSSWDEEAEIYLRRVILEGSGRGNGAVPSVFPTPIFEASWITSTLLHGGLSQESLGKENLGTIASYLEEHYHAQNGLLGFAPSVQADADDSAKVILTLNLLGRQAHAKSMTEHFRSKNGHFCTYPGERDASFSANCNVLKALLEGPAIQDYVPEISSILDYLCEAWWNGAIRDKWNISSQYSMMLLAEALIRVLEIWDQGHLDQLPDNLLRDRVPIILIQILNRTLMGQIIDGLGQADQLLEPAAYAVLTLKTVFTLPWFGPLKEDIVAKIEQCQAFLRACGGSWNKRQYLWVEKVTYGSPLLSEAYYLAAVKEMKQPCLWTEKVQDLVPISKKDKKKVTYLFSKLQCFRSEPAWKTHACVIEGLVFLRQLRSSHANVLGGEQFAENAYLSFIPCTWVVVNIVQKLFLDTYLLWDMMVLTLGNFRVDEYMETAIAQLGELDLKETRSAIQSLCNRWTTEDHPLSNWPTMDLVNDSSSQPSVQETPSYWSAGPPTFANVQTALSSYIDMILGHPRIARASRQNRSTLSTALSTFLNSHIDQSLTNTYFFSQKSSPSSLAPQSRSSQSFTEWLHTIGAPSVSAPFSFTFLTCLIGGFSTSTTRYLATDFGERVAFMSRMYNDLGSVARDRSEGNVNCLDFAELHEGQTAETAKRRLVKLAQYERDAARWVGMRLVSDLRLGKARDKGRQVDAVKLFLGVAELYADLYEVKDLSNRLDGSN